MYTMKVKFNKYCHEIVEWTINPVYTDDLKTHGKYQQIIGRLNGDKFRTGYIKKLVEVNGKFMIFRVQESGGSRDYKLYFDEHFEPTYEDRYLYGWDYDYIYMDPNDRFKIRGFLDKDYNRPWFTTPITFVERFEKYLLAHTESGSTYLLEI